MATKDDLLIEVAEENESQKPVAGEETIIPAVQPIEPTPTEPPIPVAGDEGKYSLTDFGEYKTVDEVKERLKKAEQYDQAVPEYEGLKTKYSEIETQLNEAKTKPRHKNPIYERLEVVEETRPGDLDLFKEVVFSKPDPVKLIKLDLIQQYPSLKDNKEMLDRKLKKDYPGYFGEDIDPQSDEYQNSLLDINLNAENILSRYKKEFDGIQLPEAPKPPDPKLKEQFENGWTQQLTKELKSVGKISIEVLSEDGKSKETLMDIDPGDATKYIDQAMSFIRSNAITMDKDSVEKIKYMVKQLYILDNLDAYNTKIAEYIAKQEGKKWRKTVNNSQERITPVIQINTATDQEASEKRIAAMLNN